MISKNQNLFFGMFGSGGGASAPKPPKPPPVNNTPIPVYTPPPAMVTPVKKAEENADTKGDNAGIEERRKLIPRTVDREGTILTGGSGDTTHAPVKKKTLLGG